MMLDMLMMRVELRTRLAISISHGRADGEGLMQAVTDPPVCNPWAWHVYKEHVNLRGERCQTMAHEMLLPHELVACFYKRDDLFRLLTGDPGATCLQSAGHPSC